MNINSLITKDYRKKDDFAVRKNKPNSNPIFVKPKMNVNLYVIEDYKNKPRLPAQGKQTQSNPTCRGVAPSLCQRCETGSPAPTIFFKKIPKKMLQIFKKLLIRTCFLFDNSIVLHTIYTERHVYQSIMEKVYNAN